jgi:hypothetical protein
MVHLAADGKAWGELKITILKITICYLVMVPRVDIIAAGSD